MNDSIEEQFVTISDTIILFKMQLNTLHQQIKTIEKSIKKEMKIVKNNKKDKEKSKREPSGFAKPTRVTKELCSFMDKPEGTEIARTEVTKALVSYIKTNNLVETGKDAKQKIVPDEKLKLLLGLKNDEITDLNYFNIQKYMNKHFFKNTISTEST
jgi:hypothetical protein